MKNHKDSDDLVTLVELLDADKRYSLTQLCDICHVSQTVVFKYMEYDVIDPGSGDELMFRQAHVDRLLKGIRLQRDLELNHAGVALALDLLDTIKQLKKEVGMLRVNSGVKD